MPSQVLLFAAQASVKLVTAVWPFRKMSRRFGAVVSPVFLLSFISSFDLIDRISGLLIK